VARRVSNLLVAAPARLSSQARAAAEVAVGRAASSP
jgi:hypothetical protein